MRDAGGPIRFRDRSDAGRRLAGALSRFAGRPDVLVLALPRGGVPVGFEIARALGAPLDVLVVRKLGAPGQEELAIGAIASGGVEVLDEDLVRALGVTPDRLRDIEAYEAAELDRRERACRGERPPARLQDRTVIVVDDGVATGSSLFAAIGADPRQRPATVVAAVPVGPAGTIARLREVADDVVCLGTPSPFGAVGEFYMDFGQTSDEEVRRLLGESARVPETSGIR